MSVLYVIAGPNGIGKTTSCYDLVPGNIPIINSDEIAKELLNTKLPSWNKREYANQEAIRLMEEERSQKNTFAIETNLADNETWKFLLTVQKTGYLLHLIYLSTDDFELLNSRVVERTRLGGHFVRPDIVKERYINGLSLLKHYFAQPDKLQLFDNSDNLALTAEFNRGTLLYKATSMPKWATAIFDFQAAPQTEKQSVKDMSIEEVRKLYKETKSGKLLKDKNRKM